MSEALVAYVDVQAAAGTPFTGALLRVYLPRAVAVHLGESPEAIARQLGPQTRVVRGPFVFGIHEHVGRPVRYVTILRDPVQQVVATYERVRRQPGHTLHRMVVEEEIGLEEFVRSEVALLDTRNPQLRRVLGRRLGEPTEVWLEAAKEVLAGFAAVGPSEAFPGFLVLCAQELGWGEALDGLADLAQAPVPHLEVSATAAEVIAEHNRLDTELYGFARSLFAERAGRIPDLDARLDALLTAQPAPPSGGRRTPGRLTPRRVVRAVRRTARRVLSRGRRS